MAANGNLFSAADRTALVVLARALYPHPGLGDAPYARTADSIVERASVDPVLYHVLTDGLAELRRACAVALELTPAPELQAALRDRESGAFFRALRPLVAWYLYDDHEVWEFVGYPGASYEFGGYLHRGFDDLSWLPEPRIEEPDEALPEIGPLAAMEGRAVTRYALDDTDVAVIIGSGPGGATLALQLARAGFRIVMLEAGKWISNEDFVNDERKGFDQLSWKDPRLATGTWGLARNFPGSPAWMGKTVGGTATFWTGLTPRFKAHEFRTRSVYGDVPDATLLDWPIGLDELAPYYDRAEIAMGTSHRHGRPPLPANNNYKVLANGAERAGYRHYATGPYATNRDEYDGRPGTVQDGFCQQGDKSRAKWSPLVSEIPKALATGLLELRTESHAVQVTLDSSGRADGVVYADATGALHRQSAALVAVAGNAIETPRLLLQSATTGHEQGLANSSGQLGRHYMRHTTGVLYAEFDKPIHMYRGESMAGIINDESRHDPNRGFVGGYYLELIAQGLPSFTTFMAPGAWGPDFTSRVEAYTRTAAIWICGEDMPRETNRVMLSDSLVDQFGLPVPVVHSDDHPNDLAMADHGYAQAERVFASVGAKRFTRAPAMPSGHNLGTARMSVDPADGVTNEFGQTHDIKNLFVSDGSLFTTGAAANPTLTIMAVVMRQADHIIETSKTF